MKDRESAFTDRRTEENRLKRISLESERQEDSQIMRWLDLGSDQRPAKEPALRKWIALGKRLFDSDDDPTPSQA